MKSIDRILVSLLLVLVAASAYAAEGSDSTRVNYMPTINGTIRGKYEYQPEMSASRFQVRNARVSITGNVSHYVSYKAEIDLSDEGRIRMLDAFARWKPIDGGGVTIGQMRVPFSIDAHRSPHQQYFANRSFIAKHVGNVRDVGATLYYKFNPLFPITLEGGLFNGSGLTDQKDFWTSSVNFSAKAQLQFWPQLNFVMSVQKVRPETLDVYMYSVGATWRYNNWMLEAEWLHKTYEGNGFDDMNAANAMINYDIILNRKLLYKVSPLARFDYMGDHSDGTLNEQGELYITDYARSRLTVGVTLSLVNKPFVADLRLNYENYFYKHGAQVKVSEQDKFVAEIMVRF